MDNIGNYVVTAVSLTAANFIYARMSRKEYGKAFERSYFQVLALLLLYISTINGVIH